MRGNIQDMQISDAFPIIFGVLGGKGFEKDGAHMFRGICIPPDAQFAYGEICIVRALDTMERDESYIYNIHTYTERSIEWNLGIGDGPPLHPPLIFT